MKLSYFLIIFFISSISSKLFTDIKSQTGEINFSINSNSSPSLKLTNTGLGVHETTPTANLHVNGNAIISEDLYIGTTSGSSNLHLNGTYGHGYSTFTSNVVSSNLIHSLNFLNAASGYIKIDLPDASLVNGRVYEFKQINQNHEAYIYAGNTSYIDNSPTFVMNSSENLSYLKIVSNGSQWYQLIAPTTEETLVSDNLVRWYKFDQTSGNRITDYGSSQVSGNLTNDLDFDTDSITGVINQGLDFSNNDYVALDSDQGLPEGAEPRSILAWIKPATYSTQTIIGWGTNAGGKRCEFALRGGNYVVWAISGVAYGSSEAPAAGNWFHVAITYDGGDVSTMNIYINGELKTLTKQAGSDRTVNTVLNGVSQIATNTTRDSNFYSGDIDDARIYDRALSAEEVDLIYQTTPKP